MRFPGHLRMSVGGSGWSDLWQGLPGEVRVSLEGRDAGS